MYHTPRVSSELKSTDGSRARVKFGKVSNIICNIILAKI